MTKPLQDQVVLLTRPDPKNQYLQKKIIQLGGDAVVMPMIKIVGIDYRISSSQLEQCDVMIFTSQAAVQHADATLTQYSSQMAATFIAVGQATAAALREFIPNVLVAPEPANSESLLGLPILNRVAGKRITIVKGCGGRDLLPRMLTSREAIVSELNVYRREAVHYAELPERLDDVTQVIASSNGILQAIVDELVKSHGQAWLLDCPLVVMSQRQAHLAQQLGFNQSVRVAQSAGDDAIIDKLIPTNAME